MINLKPCLDASRVHDEKELFVLQCVPDSTKRGRGKGRIKGLCPETERERICGQILEGEQGTIYQCILLLLFFQNSSKEII